MLHLAHTWAGFHGSAYHSAYAGESSAKSYALCSWRPQQEIPILEELVKVLLLWMGIVEGQRDDSCCSSITMGEFPKQEAILKHRNTGAKRGTTELEQLQQNSSYQLETETRAGT